MDVKNKIYLKTFNYWLDCANKKVTLTKNYRSHKRLYN